MLDGFHAEKSREQVLPVGDDAVIGHQQGVIALHQGSSASVSSGVPGVA